MRAIAMGITFLIMTASVSVHAEPNGETAGVEALMEELKIATRMAAIAKANAVTVDRHRYDYDALIADLQKMTQSLSVRRVYIQSAPTIRTQPVADRGRE